MELLEQLAARLGRERWFTYTGPEVVFEELRTANSGGVVDYSGITY